MSAFELDRGNSKLMGVCAGIGRATSIDPLLVRIAAVLLVLAFGPIMIAAYLLAAWLVR